MRWLLTALLVVWIGAVHANVEALQFDTPQMEKRYRHLINELRCLVCQNQNLADSNAELAQDLRRKTYEMIAAGKTDAEIIDYMVERYGDFVLYRPPVNRTTAVLWYGPFLILIIAFVLLIRLLRRRARQPRVEMSDEAKAQARKLLEENDGGSR
jgi:cytochrome c-type biogenesis protein CcmH